MQKLLRDFSVRIDIPVAWGEMDAFQHVNNIVYFRYFESARIAYFEEIGYNKLMLKTGLGPILASAQCKFRFPLTYPDTVTVAVKASDLLSDRFTMRFRIASHQAKAIAAEGSGLVVSYDYNQNQKTPLPKEIREQIALIENQSEQA